MEKQRRLDKNIDGQLTVILRDIKEEKCMISEVTEKDREGPRGAQTISQFCQPRSGGFMAALDTDS